MKRTPEEYLEDLLEELEVHIHLHSLIQKIKCPSLNGEEVLIYLARQRFGPEKRDIKYYYNCNKALRCKDEYCIFRKSVEALKEKEAEEESPKIPEKAEGIEAFYSIE